MKWLEQYKDDPLVRPFRGLLRFKGSREYRASIRSMRLIELSLEVIVFFGRVLLALVFCLLSFPFLVIIEQIFKAVIAVLIDATTK